MQMNHGVTRSWAMRHPQAMKTRDVVINFEFVPPDIVEVSERVSGEIIHSQRVQQHRDIVTELERQYIFFANEADIARRLILRGRSCVLSVYFREL